MGHGGGVAAEALDAAQAFGQREELKFLQHGDGVFFPITLEHEGNHAAEVAHLRGGHGVVGVRLEARPVHFFHSLVLAQILGHGAAVFGVALHPQVQGFEAAQHQKAVLRAGSAAAGVLQKPQALMQLVVLHHKGAHHGVGVAGHVLGERVHHDVGAQIERRLQVGRTERVIDGQQRPGLLGHGGGGPDVDDVEQRVSRCLNPDELGLRADFFAHRAHVAHRHEVKLDAVGRENFGEEAVGAAVEVVGADDLVAGLEQLYQAVDGGHAGGEGQAVLPVFQRRHRVLQLGAGGVVGARVLVAFVVAGAALHIGRGLVNGRHNGPGFGVGVDAGVDGFGSEFHRPRM